MFHGNYDKGLFVSSLPARFTELFKALEGQEMLDLTEDIKFIHVRILDVLKCVDTGESGERWRQAVGTYKTVREAQSLGDTAMMASKLNDLGGILKQGLSDWRAWDTAVDLVLKKTRVVESQRKRAVESHEMLALSEVTEMMRAQTEALKRAVEKCVPEDEMRRAVLTEASSEIARLYGVEHCGPTSKREH